MVGRKQKQATKENKLIGAGFNVQQDNDPKPWKKRTKVMEEKQSPQT